MTKTTTKQPIPPDVTIERASTPSHRVRFVRHNMEPIAGERKMEVVLLERSGDPDYPGERIIITDVAGASWPYSEEWGAAMTVDQALRLADLLNAAASTILNEQDG